MSSILRYITADDESRMLAKAERTVHADGEVILREGERPRRLYILRRGGARVERNHGEFNVEISRLERGELFGEMGFIEDFPASASVVAQGECEVLTVAEAHVLAFADSDPGFAGRFYRSIAELLSRRLRATSVEALSEFSWGTGSFQRVDADTDADAGATPADGTGDSPPAWGGGSPLREDGH